MVDLTLTSSVRIPSSLDDIESEIEMPPTGSELEQMCFNISSWIIDSSELEEGVGGNGGDGLGVGCGGDESEAVGGVVGGELVAEFVVLLLDNFS